ncbi:MAG TPA: hypothetical protein DCK93_08300 [Blastocatellia bacterium]|nr:hypothetical protein [Blastocatellia bacterium]
MIVQRLFFLLTAGLAVLFSFIATQSNSQVPIRRGDDEPMLVGQRKGSASDHATGPESQLLEIGRASRLRPVAQSPADLKVVSYNIRWRSGDDLKKLGRLLKDDAEVGGASILGLQEVDRHKERSGKTNTARTLAEDLGMHYAWAAPPAPKSEQEEETGVVILSSYPLTDVHRIVLPSEGPGRAAKSRARRHNYSRSKESACLFRPFGNADCGRSKTRTDESGPGRLDSIPERYAGYCPW